MPASGLVISQIQDVTIVDFRNTSILDGSAVEAIAGQLYPLADQQARRKILLDFSAVRFLSSQLVGVLLALHKKAKAIKGRFILCGLRPELHKVFKIMKLEKILEFADSEEEALVRFDVFTRP